MLKSHSVESHIAASYAAHQNGDYLSSYTQAVDAAYAARDFGIQLSLKRVFDVVSASIALVMLSPLLFVTALLIKLESKGPVIYKQQRGGLNGTSFMIYKFRTMTHEACMFGEAKHATPSDPRVTLVGRCLRQTSIDELPQLWNVIKGDMAVVGPRPHMLDHDAHYTRSVVNYQQRFRMKPGITGLAQASGLRGYIHTPDQMQARVDADNAYINGWSLWLDVRIILKTVLMVLNRKNAH